ncbi:MAG: dihydroneopterin aldolase [Flavobacteriales bacterium]|nr:dihydroneopterin aldolase [Flavobacteriales bacterium]
MKHKIEVNGIQLYAFHGCLEEEARIGGKYEVDVKILTDFTEAALTDDLAKTVDYVAVNRIVAEEMAIRSKLIEHVGLRILNRLKSEITHEANYSVRIIKISPPINGDVRNVVVELEA